MKILKPLLAMLVVLLVMDAIWIVGFMQGLYESEIGAMLKTEPNLLAALLFYVGYPVGAYFLGVRPALRNQSLQTALINGGVLGAMAYGTFAVTNLSVLQGWTPMLTVTDTVWGTFVTAMVSVSGYLAAR